MRLSHDHVRVRVPATSANLGPGFDTLGLAVGIYDEIDVRAIAGDTIIEVVGYGSGIVPKDENHLVAQAIRAGLEALGAPLTGLHLQCHNRIPHGSGLGSSAAAVVAGLAAASRLVGAHDALGAGDLLDLAQEFEGHPDNAAPAILGGLTIAWTTPAADQPDRVGQSGRHLGGASWPGDARGRRASAVKVGVSEEIVPVVLIPDTTLATTEARTALPARVPLVDAAANVARASLLMEVLTRRPDPELLLLGTEDLLHQEYRESSMPATLDLVRRLRAAGWAAVVSGSGPSILVLGAGDVEAQVAGISELATGWQVLAPGVARDGVQTVALSA